VGDSATGDGMTAGEERTDRVPALVREFASLHRLALQLQRRAADGDSHALHAILSRREAVLKAIRACLGPGDEETASGGENESPGGPDPHEEERRRIARTLREIVALDEASRRLLEQQAAAVVADIHKLRAGRKWRESSGKWK